MVLLSVVFSTLLAVITAVNAISTISIKGTKFYNAQGQQVFWKGIAYQRSPYDPFANETQCQFDAQLMQTLGANAIRTYHVDPTQNHTACMQAFSNAGIYVFVDLDTFNTQIEQTNPEWSYSQYQAFTAVIDAFAGYDNIAGFFVANEAVTTPNGTDAAPYVKAAVRDCKAYMKSKGGRYIPMGYSAADIASIRPMLQNYLACPPEDAALDFFAVNIYEWCGSASTYQTSGYADRIAELSDYPIPSFFSETGCIAVRPRTFSDMPAIYGSQMTPVLSGAFVYEWTQETNDYGIITYPATATQDGLSVPVGSPVPIQPEFNNLMSQWSANIPSSTSEAAYSPSISSIACPATTNGTWPINGDAALPGTPSEEDPTPAYGGASASATGAGGASGSSSSSSASASASGKSVGSKVGGNEGVGAWFAFLAACVALGCLV